MPGAAGREMTGQNMTETKRRKSASSAFTSAPSSNSVVLGNLLKLEGGGALSGVRRIISASTAVGQLSAISI